jgi:hypothetical protein
MTMTQSSVKMRMLHICILTVWVSGPECHTVDMQQSWYNSSSENYLCSSTCVFQQALPSVAQLFTPTDLPQLYLLPLSSENYWCIKFIHDLVYQYFNESWCLCKNCLLSYINLAIFVHSNRLIVIWQQHSPQFAIELTDISAGFLVSTVGTTNIPARPPLGFLDGLPYGLGPPFLQTTEKWHKKNTPIQKWMKQHSKTKTCHIP